jgi:hypothetical protein
MCGINGEGEDRRNILRVPVPHNEAATSMQVRIYVGFRVFSFLIMSGKIYGCEDRSRIKKISSSHKLAQANLTLRGITI